MLNIFMPKYIYVIIVIVIEQKNKKQHHQQYCYKDKFIFLQVLFLSHLVKNFNHLLFIFFLFIIGND